jgi:hypothetical protein
MISVPQSEVDALPDLAVSHRPESLTQEKLATDSPPRSPAVIACAIALVSFGGVAFALWLRTVFAGYPDPRSWFNAFYVLFARHEPAGLSIVALFYLAAATFLWRSVRPARETIRSSPEHLSQHAAKSQRLSAQDSGHYHTTACVLTAILVFAVAKIGTTAVLHDYLLTADEYLADFQAQIFLRGKIQAEVPAAWVDAIRVIKPTHVEYSPKTHLWMSTYLPVYAAMRAAFQYFDLQTLLNPVLAAVTILALYGAARRIWPESQMNALIGVGLLASSSQFLLMSMTAYAMSAHLALNTIWLWLYLRPERREFYLAPIVGALAIGLHQPIVHALFVLPFLARLVWEKRWRPVLIFGAIYLGACVFWYAWKRHFASPTGGSNGISSIFRLVNPSMAIIQPMNLLLIIAWASLATPLLAVLGFKRAFKAPSVLQDAALSCALTFGFYYFFYLDQAHGWGYRYFYGAIGCLILLAVAGFERLSILIGQRRALIFAVSGIALSFLVQLPLRCVQAESFVRPYARAAEAFRNVPAKIVAFNPCDAWYSADLIRNDPFLEQRPIIVTLLGLTQEALPALEKNGPARIVPVEDLARMGLSTHSPDHYGRDPLHLGRGE